MAYRFPEDESTTPERGPSPATPAAFYDDGEVDFPILAEEARLSVPGELGGRNTNAPGAEPSHGQAETKASPPPTKEPGKWPARPSTATTTPSGDAKGPADYDEDGGRAGGGRQRHTK